MRAGNAVGGWGRWAELGFEGGLGGGGVVWEAAWRDDGREVGGGGDGGLR